MCVCACHILKDLGGGAHYHEDQSSCFTCSNTNNGRYWSRCLTSFPLSFTFPRISAVLAPARSGETETQRSSKARLVRSTRRSTQGISNDVLEEARKRSNVVVGASGDGPAAVGPAPVQVSRSPQIDTLNSTEFVPRALLLKKSPTR